MNFIDRQVNVNYSVYDNRPKVGVFLHDTESLGPLRVDQSLGSWHWLIDRDGTKYRDVDEENVAWGVFATGWSTDSIAKTRWRPPWLVRCPDGGVSDANYCGIHIELVSHQQYRDQGIPFTDAQYDSLQELIADIHSRYGSLPWVGHGQMQTDRTDPVAFDWVRAGFGLFETNWGYAWQGILPPVPMQPPEDDEAMLTLDEKATLDMLRALGKANTAEIDLLIRHESRAAEIGRGLAPKRLSVAQRQSWGQELASFTQR